MQKFVNFVDKYKEYITFASLIVISLCLISMGNVSRIGGFRTVVIGTVGWIQELFAWVPNPGALQSENQAVRELNLQLSSEVIRGRHSLIENQRLRQLIGLREKIEEPCLSSEVVGKSTIELRSYISLDKGESNDVKEGMAVRTDAGLVGSIAAASSDYSLVELITNRSVRIAAKIQRTNISGIVVWEGGSNFFMKNLPKSFDVQAGDIVITSSFSNKYPPEIPLGQIIKVEDDPGSLFLLIQIQPFVDFSSLEQVFIVKHLPDPERIELIKKMEDRLIIREGKSGK